MKKEARGKFDRSKVVRKGIVELPEEQHQRVVRQEKIADDECRVNFRWGSSQLGMVKQVAELMGVPYQQYIKQVLYRQAQADLQKFGRNEAVTAQE